MKIVTADITGSLIVNGVNVTDNVVSSSVFSGSIAGRVTNLEQFSASLDATFATDASVTASILVLSQSVQASQAALSSSYTATSASYVIVSGSYAAASASLSIRTTNLEATASINTQASASFAAYSASVSTRLTTDETNITTLTNASASFAAQSASLSTRLTTDETNYTNLSSSFATTSGSIAGRVTLIEGQYATTGSNTFTKPQQITDVSNATGFTSTASLYTDGGLRVKGAAYISGTAYFNDVVVYGTSSIEYITSSQLAIGTNIITLNTDTPSIRYGGISVYDSGSNNLSTGSLFWDSEKDKWIYSNPSGSTYDGGMLISGPRNTSGLGNEVGTTSCALMMGQGGDHITSSAIFSYGNATCFYGNSYVSSSGLACFGGIVCSAGNILLGGAGTANTIPQYTAAGVLANSKMVTYGNGCYNVNFGWSNCARIGFDNDNTGTYFYGLELDNGTRRLNIIGKAPDGNSGVSIWTGTTSYDERVNVNVNGITCFACQVCAPVSIITGCASIGSTSAPSSTLDITRSSPDPFNTVQCQLSLINGGGNGGAGTQLNFNVGGAIPFIRGLVDGANSTAGAALVFGTANSNTAGTERMRISNSGCVGVGATSPAATMHLCTINISSVLRVESACDQAGLRLIAGVPGTARATRIDFLNGATCIGRPQWTVINDYSQNGTNEFSIINCDPATKVLQILQSGVSCFLGAMTIATGCRAFGRGLTVFSDIVSYYSDAENITMGISGGTGAQSWGIQVCDTGDGGSALHLNARGGNVGINKGSGNTADFPLDVTGTIRSTSTLIGAGGNISTSTICTLASTTLSSSRGILVDANTTTNNAFIPIGYSWASSVSTYDPNWGMALKTTNYNAGTADLVFYTGGNVRMTINNGGALTLTSSATLPGNLFWNSGDGVNWYIQGQANGPTIRMKYHGGSTDRSGALGWIDNGGNRYEALTWQDTTVTLSGRLYMNSLLPLGIVFKNTELADGDGNNSTVTDTQATNGNAKRRLASAPSTTFFYGPYQTIPAGTYIAYFRLKVANNSSNSTILYIDITNVTITSGSGTYIAPNGFAASDRYQYFKIPFTVTNPSAQIEFRGLSFVSGITDIFLDHILILPGS